MCCGTDVGEFGTPFVNGQIAFNLGTSNNPLSYPANPALATPLGPNGLPVPTPGTPYFPPDIYSDPVHMPVPYVYLYSTQLQYSLPKDPAVTVHHPARKAHHSPRLLNL